MNVENLNTETNTKVARWILAKYRTENSCAVRCAHPHLVECSDAAVTDLNGTNGTCGCETGCEYAVLTATISCPHGDMDDWKYGEFGDMASMLDEILSDE
jgi:hypothetical protein